MNSVENYLVKRDDGLIKLLTLSLTKEDLNPDTSKGMYREYVKTAGNTHMPQLGLYWLLPNSEKATKHGNSSS